MVAAIKGEGLWGDRATVSIFAPEPGHVSAETKGGWKQRVSDSCSWLQECGMSNETSGKGSEACK